MSSLMKTSWDFLKRHRNKALVCVGAVGTVYALNRYLRSVAEEWQTSSSRDFVSEVKKKEIHFENTIETCNQTSISLSEKIIDILDKNLDADVILAQMKAPEVEGKPIDHKIQLWHRLKVRIFTRVISEVYCVVLFVAYLRVQLSILAGYIYVDSSGGHNSAPLMAQMTSSTSSVQNKYLSLLHNFYTDGIQQIVEPIMSAVEDSLHDINLKDQIVMEDLTVVFDKVKTSMAFNLCGSHSNASRFLLNPKKFFDSDSNGKNGISGKDMDLLKRMVNETQDILESDDFKRVIDAGIDLGFSVVKDIIIGCFIRIADESEGQKTANGFANPHAIRIPFVKLLPKIWHSLQERRKPEERLVIVRHLICLDVLNCFAANIYEAFCEQN